MRNAKPVVSLLLDPKASRRTALARASLLARFLLWYVGRFDPPLGGGERYARALALALEDDYQQSIARKRKGRKHAT